MKITDVMTKDVITLRPDQTLEEAAKVLVARGISGVPVVLDDKVVGILSERDLLEARTAPKPPRYLELLGGVIFIDDVRKYQTQLKKIIATRVEQVMTKDVATIEVDAPLEEAAKIILSRGINRVPVLEEGRLVGIVTRSDILRGTVDQ